MKKVINVFVLLMGIVTFMSACGNAKEAGSAGDFDVIEMQEKEAETSVLAEAVESIITPEATPDAQEQYFTALTIESVEMMLGETYQVELEQEIPNIIWSSSDEKVVQVAQGQLKAVAPGNATVTLSAGVNAVSFDVTVNTFPNLTLAVNCSDTIELNDAIADVRWESSAPEIVSVENGVITSLAAGASNITVYMGEATYTFEVVATTPDITATSVRKIIGNTQQIYIFGTNGTVTWKSDNTAIATVSDTGLITAEATGAGQSTIVHAYVDGMDFQINVAVEPIPQLSSTYKMYGYNNDYVVENGKLVTENGKYAVQHEKITLCANANETVTFGYHPAYYYSVADKWFESTYHEIKDVLNVADADYSDGMTFPVYRAFGFNYDVSQYIEVYLVGTSQTANVIAQSIADNREQGKDGIALANSNTTVTYEPCEDYGIIRVYFHANSSKQGELITVSVDGYQYQFIVESADFGFAYRSLDLIPVNYMIEECSVDEVVDYVAVNIDYSAISSNSRTYFGNNEWIDRIGTKFVEAVEDEAISMAASFLLKSIFF